MLSFEKRRPKPAEVAVMFGVFVVLLLVVVAFGPSAPSDVITNYCPQVAALSPPKGFANSSMFFDEAYVQKSLRRLQGAVQIPTQSYDDLDDDPTKDSRFEIFKNMTQYLFTTFPLTAKYVETVNTYGLLYTIPGSDSSLKPAVLMAHTDVVPVNEETIDDWDYPPFSAAFDGEWVYGRGAADTKNSLIAELEAVEELLSQGWSPRRTLILSFGFDEEVSGKRGAKELVKTLLGRYGPDSLEVIIDEGFGMPEMYGGRVAIPLVGEKGAAHIGITIKTQGGHSSMPPPHTAIGIMSRLIRKLEAEPFPPTLLESNPVVGLYRCLAEHAPRMQQEFRRDVLNLNDKDHRDNFISTLDADREQRYMIRTSQAVDIIEGGVKVNALPEVVSAVVDHRIVVDSSPEAVLERAEEYVIDIARLFDFGVVSDGEELLAETRNGLFNVTMTQFFEPPPLSPHSGDVWDTIAGTVRNIFGNDTIVAPGVFPANTDARHYWPLTRHAYRFVPSFKEDMENQHTVNERLRFRSHLFALQWFYEYILNVTF